MHPVPKIAPSPIPSRPNILYFPYNNIIVLHRMTPYLVLSGKSIDDLGFPGSCMKDINKYQYFTVEVMIEANTTIATEYTGYLGFCFTNMCSV